MKCRACDEILHDHEAKRKSRVTGEYLDLCDICLFPIATNISASLDEHDSIWDKIEDAESATEDDE